MLTRKVCRPGSKFACTVERLTLMKKIRILIMALLLAKCSHGDKKREDFPGTDHKKEMESEKKMEQRDSMMSPETHTHQ
jgi:hypothetical protein